MKKLFYFSLLLFALSAISCREYPKIFDPIVSIVMDGVSVADNLSIAEGDTLRLKAVVEQGANLSTVWSVDGAEVSRGVECQVVTSGIGRHIVSLVAENSAGVKSKAEISFDVHGKFRDGAFVLNEGNMSTGNGSLVFINGRGAITDSAYWKVNNSYLGNSAQDMHIAGGKIYVISQNGTKLGGDGMLVVADAATLRRVAAYNEELSTLSWPTNISVVGNNAYIRDGNGVHLFDIEARTLTLIAGSAGAAGNRMAVVGNKVFVPAGAKIYVIEGDQIVHTMELGGTVSGVIKTVDNKLFVAVNSTPAKILKIDPTDYSIIQTNDIPEAAIGAGYGKMPAISAKGDSIYFSNATTRIYRHIFNQKQTTYLLDVKDYIIESGVVYNNLSVDPQSGEVYFNTIKDYDAYLINDIAVFNFSKLIPALRADYKNHTQFPAGIFFTANF